MKAWKAINREGDDVCTKDDSNIILCSVKGSCW